MKEHDKNRHNIGVVSRFKRGNSANMKRLSHEDQNMPDKLPSLIGEHKKVQPVKINARKIKLNSEIDQPIPKIEEEENDWMIDSVGESTFEVKSFTPSHERYKHVTYSSNILKSTSGTNINHQS